MKKIILLKALAEADSILWGAMEECWGPEKDFLKHAWGHICDQRYEIKYKILRQED